MRIALLALGSRGDVQPFIALGLALQQRGHSVRLLAASDYEPLVERYGLPFASLGGSIDELMDRELVLDALDAAGRGLPLDFAQRFVAQVGAHLPGLAADALLGCTGAELVVASTLGVYVGAQVAERLALPLVPAHFHPLGASAVAPDISFPPLRLGPLNGAYNRITHMLARHGLWQLLRGPLNNARQRALGLPALSRRGLWHMARRDMPLVLYGYSEALLARPPDWPPTRQITGFWLLEAPANYAPPAELLRFLAAGAPPVYIGFGSLLNGRDPAALVQLLAEALRRAGRRGIIYRGAWGDLEASELPDELLSLGEVPHAWLFPRVAAVVCHGGAGTVAAALAAGAPVVTVPAYGDMHLWGRRVAALGAGPPPLPRASLTAASLAAAIDAACAPATRTRAAELGAQLRAEHGPAQAAAALETLFPPNQH